jgi:hypothetical protein
MEHQKKSLVFAPINYFILIGGIVLIVLGMIIMSSETAEGGLGTLGLTVGPMTILAGLAVEFFAIMYKAPEKK